MTTGREKPDTSRQSEGFDEVHAGLTIGQIAVARDQLRVCGPSARVSELRARNRDPVYDHLPVEDADGHLIGMFESATASATRDGEETRVADRMDPLSEADLIGAETPIVDLIGRIRRKPFLVVFARGTVGMVAWSDLQKLPVRAAIFALVTGFELTMYEAIKRRFGNQDDGIESLKPTRQKDAQRLYHDQRERDSDVDLLLCTQFCDKRDILIEIESFDFGIGKKKLEKKLRAIERVRDAVAHGNNYAMSFAQVERLRDTLRDLRELRAKIDSMAR